jgi:hypothetical protein
VTYVKGIKCTGAGMVNYCGKVNQHSEIHSIDTEACTMYYYAYYFKTNSPE